MALAKTKGREMENEDKIKRMRERLVDEVRKHKQRQERRIIGAFRRHGLAEIGADEIEAIAKKTAATPPEERARMAEFGKRLLAEQRAAKGGA